MTTTVHHINVVVNGKIADTVVLLDKGGNHATIENKGHVLFDGYILEAYKIWEDKMKEYKTFSDAGFLTIDVIK